MTAPENGRRNTGDDPIVSELKGIKRLLVLFLMKAGTTQEELALALDVDQTTISKMIPKRKVQRFSK